MIKMLTIKQENFCFAYIETGNASEAYRRAYKVGKMSSITINRAAKELIDNPKITTRLAQLRIPIKEKYEYNLDRAMAEAEQAFNIAKNKQNASAMVAAVTLRAKMNGLLIERPGTQPGLFDAFTHAELTNLKEALLSSNLFNDDASIQNSQ